MLVLVAGLAVVFANGVYLFNPKDQNDTLSAPALLNPVGPQVVDERFRYNSVIDSYLFRVGVGYPVPKVPGLALSFAGRIEGVPVEDVFGDNKGFRRPGYYASLEPGINYSVGRATFALSAPMRIHQNVKDDTFGFKRDSTFADHVLLMSVSMRFGGTYSGPAVLSNQP